MADLSFAFDGNKQADPSARKRVTEAMMGAPQQMPQDVGSGLQALGNALYQRQQMRNAAFPAPPAPLPGQQAPSFSLGNFLANRLGMNTGRAY